MTEQDVDDVAFLTGTNHRVTAPISHSICQSSPLIHNRDSGGVVGNESNSNQAKKSLYENHGVAACSHNKALCIATIVFAFLFTLAVIIAFTGPQSDCPCAGDIKSSYVDEKTNMTKTFEPRATNGQIFPWNNIRLPTSLKPHRYNLTIHPNLTTLEVRSQVSIEFQAEKDTNFMVLHCKNLTILDKIIQDRHGNNLTIIKMLEYIGGQQLYIEIREKFRKRHNYVLRIRYNFKLNTDSEGFYISSYTTKDGEKRYLATTHFEPTFARTAFPCFDEPQLKAKFRLTVFRDRFHISLFNTPIVKTDVLGFYMGTGLLYDEFLETNEISTYLVAFVICDFSQQNKQTESGVSVSIYTPEPFISRAPFTLDTASFFLDYYENFFGIAFPLPKLDIVALPEFDYGAMENWGLITYRETAIFSNTRDNETFITAHQWLITNIAHQLAHQWFGNLVTMKWWNDYWLSEGFTTLFEYQGVDKYIPEWRMMEQFIIDKTQPALALDALACSHPVTANVTDPSEIDAIFDTISLSKGTAILYMLANFLQNENLENGLNDYLSTYKYQNAEMKDLWNVLGKNTNQSLDINTIMDTWTNQMGFPLVIIKRENHTIIASQRRFLVTVERGNTTYHTLPISGYNYKWHIPLTYYTDNNSEIKHVLMNMTEAKFEVDDIKWIKANVNQTGFYRVTYDDDIWAALISTLKTDHKAFSAADRASLIDDAFSLSRAGVLNVSVALELSLYLKNEREYAPWATAIEHLKSWARRLSESLAYKAFLKYMRTLLTPVTKFIGWNKNKSHMEKLLRARVLSAAILCELNETISVAKTQFQNWMIQNKSIDPNLKEIIYSAGVKYGGMNEWQYCWNYYKNSTSANEKQILLKALGVALDPWLLQRYLIETLDTSVVKPEDVKLVLEVVAANPEGRLLAWRHLKAYWPTMHSLYGNSTILMGNLISAVTAHLSTPYDLYEVSTYFNGMDVGSASRALEQSLEIIQLNINWVSQNAEEVNNWLRKNMK
ncbi:endoplasmic reticulum aminopeptidase 1-like isoform X1 [Diorhabda sublineata]|uniref:endoplasmic reticulum aminopeptidase 1-like isoform X1 n=1 Tax=Diorhabda sublineata TaxID=1163346 RepID=UPI0024E0E9BB|nr:endoplasmic reticulum aminopeptidase 1-like isoform X1 [Diorhabda sublineata]